jgi:hypothetical protein
MSQTNWEYITKTYLYLLRGLKNTANEHSNKAAKYYVVNSITQIVIIVFSSISSALLTSNDNNTEVIRYVLLVLATTIAILSSIQALFKFPKRQLVYSKSSLSHEQLSNIVSIEISKPKKLRYQPHEFTNFILMKKMAIKRRLINALNDETDKDQENDIQMTLTGDEKTEDKYIKKNTNMKLKKVKTPEKTKNSNEDINWKQDLSSNEIKERERILINNSEIENIGSSQDEDIEAQFTQETENDNNENEIQNIINVHEQSNKTGSIKFNEILIENCMNDYENKRKKFNDKNII